MMGRKKDKPEQAPVDGADNENTATPVDENADTNVAENNSANNLAENTATTEPTSAEALAAEAFAQHNHVSKVWVDEKKGEWHLVKRHGLKEFNRP